MLIPPNAGHEGGYTIQRVENDDQRLNEQFEQQQRTDDMSLSEFEKELRNDKQSFNNVRKLSPARYRFRIVNAGGQDIRNQTNTDFNDSENKSTSSLDDYTRVECTDPAMDYCHARRYIGNKDKNVPL